jgi:hypothetical protein
MDCACAEPKEHINALVTNFLANKGHERMLLLGSDVLTQAVFCVIAFRWEEPSMKSVRRTSVGDCWPAGGLAVDVRIDLENTTAALLTAHTSDMQHGSLVKTAEGRPVMATGTYWQSPPISSSASPSTRGWDK